MVLASGAAIKSVVSGFGSMAGVLTKGVLIDTPLALAEGLKNVPRLYGEEAKGHGPITGWQSGGVVAAKVSQTSVWHASSANLAQSLGYGFYEGVTGFITQPYKGVKEDGIKGFLKGASKGTAGLIIKAGAGR